MSKCTLSLVTLFFANMLTVRFMVVTKNGSGVERLESHLRSWKKKEA